MTGSHGLTIQRAKLPASMSRMCAVAAGTDIYVFGGQADSGAAVSSIFKFDTITKKLTSIAATLPTAADSLQGWLVDTKIYLITSARALWIFDTTTETISDTGSVITYADGRTPSPTKFFLWLDGTTLYQVASHYYNVENYIDLYYGDITAYPVTMKCKTADSWGGHDIINNSSCALANGKIYIFGHFGAGSINKTYYSNRILVEDTGVVATAPNVTTGCIPVVVGTKIYLFGARAYDRSDNTWGKSYSSINIFDTETNVVQSSNLALPYAIDRARTAAAVGDSIYLFGGGFLDGTDVIIEFNTNSQTIATYNASAITSIGSMEKATLACAGKKAVSDISVTFDVDGAITYDGKTTEGKQGQTVTLKCAGKKMKTDVVINTGFALSGVWILNKTIRLTPGYAVSDSPEFVSNDTPFLYLGFTRSYSGSSDTVGRIEIRYGQSSAVGDLDVVYDESAGGWIDEAYRTVKFEGLVNVSPQFYYQFTTNAVKQ